MQGIYAIRNTRNGKVYIGSSHDVEGRFQCHKSNLRRGKASSKLQNDYDRLGESAFTYELIEEVEDRRDLIHKEIKHIRRNFAMSRGYNIAYPVASRNRALTTRLNEVEYQKLVKARGDKSESSWLLDAIFEKMERDGMNE